MCEFDPFNLHRFIDAQKSDFEIALQELKNGRKESHWIWYIFPQISGLGTSPEAQHYAIKSKKEAIAYLQHEILGLRLVTCTKALLEIKEKKIEEIMEFPDDLKLRSSMTLFSNVSHQNNIFNEVLCRYYQGGFDSKTLSILASNP